MSIYISVDGDLKRQISSNRGWGNLCRFLESIPAYMSKFPGLSVLCDTGECQYPKVIYADLKLLVKRYNVSDDIAGTITEMLEVLEGKTNNEIVITDGTSS